ncbi:MAG TPA: ribosome-associated translation inhibitor RaiA [Clostridiaceae bacterium]|nr:ribosome-associated translation inhibitor RaiA [Clostridiaceae bacterium]
MKIKVNGKNFEVTEALREKAIKKLSKLEKFFNVDAEAQVMMSVQRSRHVVEITIFFNGVVMRAEVAHEDMYAAIDKAIDRLEGQIRKNKTRLSKKIHNGAFKIENFNDYNNMNNNVEEESEFKVVRTKRFAIKPMTVDEAILQMNLLGHEFFVFSNADTLETNVVYRRKDGNYGLIEPEK